MEDAGFVEPTLLLRFRGVFDGLVPVPDEGRVSRVGGGGTMVTA
jgi:hypothetical protein